MKTLEIMDKEDIIEIATVITLLEHQIGIDGYETIDDGYTFLEFDEIIALYKNIPSDYLFINPNIILNLYTYIELYAPFGDENDEDYKEESDVNLFINTMANNYLNTLSINLQDEKNTTLYKNISNLSKITSQFYKEPNDVINVAKIIKISTFLLRQSFTSYGLLLIPLLLEPHILEAIEKYSRTNFIDIIFVEFLKHELTCNNYKNHTPTIDQIIVNIYKNYEEYYFSIKTSYYFHTI